MGVRGSHMPRTPHLFQFVTFAGFSELRAESLFKPTPSKHMINARCPFHLDLIITKVTQPLVPLQVRHGKAALSCILWHLIQISSCSILTGQGRDAIKQSDSLRTQPAAAEVMDSQSRRHFYTVVAEVAWIYEQHRRNTGSHIRSDMCKSATLEELRFLKVG